MNTRTIDAAKAELYDHSHGLFGELISADIVLTGLLMTDNVGRVDDPGVALATQAVHSFTAIQKQECIIEFDNVTSFPIMIQWMDQKGKSSPHQRWKIDPMSSLVRVSGLGHLFIISALNPTINQEHVIGAYRILMKLPSGSPHRIVLEEEAFDDSTDKNDQGIIHSTTFMIESVLSDPTGYDTLVVAAESLDPVEAGAQHESKTKSIHSLATILKNIQEHPHDPKFRTLRISNHKVQSQIISSWGAMQLLTCLGFEKENDHLILKSENPDPFLLDKATELLDQLSARSRPGFIAELAPSTPWDRVALSSSLLLGSRASFGSGGTHFLSDDEKWARAERNRQRRGRQGRRPNPGNAPSSKGKWGR